jgi:voltage-dependent potassium channel beta subunit
VEYRRIGKYGVKVSNVSLGGWLTQGRTISDETTSAIVKRAYELGVNFFDTADAYNAGEAEKSLAKALKGVRREDLFIATKCYFPIAEGPNDRGLSRKHIVESVNNSLKRLQMDYVDLMQFHRYDPETPLEESIRAVDDLIRQGKILYWGVSEWSAEQIMDGWHTAAGLNAHPPISNQPQYNMLNPSIEKAVLPTCERLGMGQVIFSPLAQGLLTGKYKPGEQPPEGSRWADESSNRFMKGWMTDENLQKVQKVVQLANENDLTPVQFALAWCLRHEGVSSVIVGATKVEQIEQNVQASEVEVDPAVWERVEDILRPNSADVS